MPGKVPDRWEEYIPFKAPIAKTRFIAFKVPLEQGICQRLPQKDWFTPAKLISSIKEHGWKLGLVIDLTNTKRYYKPAEIESHGVGYIKLNTEGRVIPGPLVQQKFAVIIDDFLERNSDNDLLIGVHCTHGLNRTGYMVCRYMIDHMAWAAMEAVQAFNEARGYAVERENYISDLLDRKGPVPEQQSVASDGEILEDEGEKAASKAAAAVVGDGAIVPNSNADNNPQLLGGPSRGRGAPGNFDFRGRGGNFRGRGQEFNQRGNFHNRGNFNRGRPFFRGDLT